jgi:hypothetical protein
MQVIFAKTKWEARELPLPESLRRARSQGFTATEINIQELSESLPGRSLAEGLNTDEVPEELFTRFTQFGSGNSL